MESVAVDDEVAQSVAWRVRLTEAIIYRQFDDETLVEMLGAGFNQAHSEGMADAADICRNVAEAAADDRGRHVAATLTKAIETCDRANRTGKSIDDLWPRSSGKRAV